MYSGEAGGQGGWDGEAPPLIIPVDLGGAVMVGAGDWGCWDGMGWDGMGWDGMVRLLQKGEWGGRGAGFFWK